MLEMLRWIREYTKKLSEKPVKLIDKTTTPLGAYGKYISPVFAVSEYKYIKIFSQANVSGYASLYFYDTDGHMIFKARKFSASGDETDVFFLTQGCRGKVEYDNEAVAQTTFKLLIEGIIK